MGGVGFWGDSWSVEAARERSRLRVETADDCSESEDDEESDEDEEDEEEEELDDEEEEPLVELADSELVLRIFFLAIL